MSESGYHRFYIDSVGVRDVAGRIGMCACPGTRRHRGLWRKPVPTLDEDLAAIRHWGASGVVSLIEDAEIRWAGLDNYFERVTAHDLWWLHLPIPDMRAPGAVCERKWPREGARLRERLRSGERFVLHCVAGLGRTGTVAARLLVELGLDPANAIAEVRHVRPGAIQSIEQELFVRRCRPV